MRKILSAVLAGVVAFFAFIVVGLIGAYLKCLGEGIHFDLNIAMRIVSKMAVYVGCVITVLTFLAGTSPKK